MRKQSSLLTMLGASPLLGRLLLPEEDQPGKPPVAVLSYRMWVHQFNSDPGVVGRNIILDGKPFTVVGVLQRGFMINAEVMPSEGPMDKMDVFMPLPLGADAAQNRGDENYNILVRLKPGVSVRQAQSDIDVIASRIRENDKRDHTFGMDVVSLEEQVVGDVRRGVLVLFVVVYGIRTMQDRLHDSLARQRFSGTMLTAFAAFALLLAAVGLYGVMSHLVTQSTRDIGVLVALGARPSDIIALVVRQAMELAGIGIVTGLVGAAALTRLMASLLFGVSTMDAATFGVVVALLATVALAATAIPAWRTTLVDPMVALREE